MSQQKPPNQIGNAFAQAMKQAAEKRRAQQQTANQEDPTPKNALKTVKPNSQEIGEKTIYWIWNGSVFDVDAKYFRVDWGNHLAGEYAISVHFDGDIDFHDYEMDAEKAKELAVLLLSANQWENDWQNHMGEFLKVKPEKKPPLRVVDEQINDAAEADDDEDEEMSDDESE